MLWHLLMSPIAIAAKQYLLYNVSSRTAICYLFKTQGCNFFFKFKELVQPMQNKQDDVTRRNSGWWLERCKNFQFGWILCYLLQSSVQQFTLIVINKFFAIDMPIISHHFGFIEPRIIKILNGYIWACLQIISPFSQILMVRRCLTYTKYSSAGTDEFYKASIQHFLQQYPCY